MEATRVETVYREALSRTSAAFVAYCERRDAESRWALEEALQALRVAVRVLGRERPPVSEPPVSRRQTQLDVRAPRRLQFRWPRAVGGGGFVLDGREWT